MPELKSVYFAPDGKYFQTEDECQKYEDIQELSKLIIQTSNKLNQNESYVLAEKLHAKYNLLDKSVYGEIGEFALSIYKKDFTVVTEEVKK
jgi:hypothetical protein